MNKPFRLFYRWFILVVAITGLAGLSYALAQQILRQSANDPQIQLAEDGARALATGAEPQSIVPADPQVDIATSLAPFVIVYDDSSKPIASSGQLDGSTPTPPTGVFDYVRAHGQERVTWQPRSDVRVASVMVRFTGQKSGFILASRSLRETENRVSTLIPLVLLASTAILGVTFLMSMAIMMKRQK